MVVTNNQNQLTEILKTYSVEINKDEYKSKHKLIHNRNTNCYIHKHPTLDFLMFSDSHASFHSFINYENYSVIGKIRTASSQTAIVASK